MKLFALTVSALALIGTAALAETPNRANMTYAEFIDASGCVIVDKGGYSNLASKDGGNCPFSVTQAWVGGYSKVVQIALAGDDDVFGTPDDETASVTVSDN